MDTISLLRSFPLIVNHKQQIAFSTLAHLLEGLSAQSKLQTGFMHEHSGKSDDDLSVSQRSKMLTSLWSTVSMLYYLDKLCRSETNFLGEIYSASALPMFAQAAASLRNARDHIGQRVGNLANRRSLPPINGLVRWTFNPRFEGQEFVINIRSSQSIRC